MEVTGYHLKETSMALAESIQSVHKSRIRGKIGHVDADSGVMDKLDAAVMLYLRLVTSDNKEVYVGMADESGKAYKKTKEKRFVRYAEGAEMYPMCEAKFQQLAKDAMAVYKINQLCLVNLDILDAYLETFRITDKNFYK